MYTFNRIDCTMRITIFVLLILASGCGAVAAQQLTLFERSLNIQVFGERVPVLVKMSAAQPTASDKTLSIKVQAEVSKILALAGKKLVALIAANHKGCKERWSAWNGAVQTGAGKLDASVTVRVEKWACKRVLGNELKTRLARETATLHASAKPIVRGGHLQLQVTAFRIDGLGAISRTFGVEARVRRELDKVITELNANPAFQSLPPELSSLGFAYESVELVSGGGRAYLHVAIDGPNDIATVLKLVAELAKRAG